MLVVSEVFNHVEPLYRIGGCVAILVDGENICHSELARIEAAANKLGSIIVRRVYGNMVSLMAWEAEASFQAVHTGKGRGKNVADMRLTIDAVDMAHRGTVTTFVIVSNDGDFAPLATWLREAGFSVIGIGRAAASQQLQVACEIYLRPEAKIEKKAQPAALCALDRRLRDVLKAKALPLTKMANAMGNVPVKQQTGKATWRAYLTMRGDLYDITEDHQQAVIRWIGP